MSFRSRVMSGGQYFVCRLRLQLLKDLLRLGFGRQTHYDYLNGRLKDVKAGVGSTSWRETIFQSVNVHECYPKWDVVAFDAVTKQQWLVPPLSLPLHPPVNPPNCTIWRVAMVCNGCTAYTSISRFKAGLRRPKNHSSMLSGQ